MMNMEVNVSNKVLQETNKSIGNDFKCSMCSRTFETKRGLMRHTYIHQSNPKFNCDVCGKMFTTQDSLARHTKSHQRDKKVIQCKHCSETFTAKLDLEEHHRNVHLDQKLFCCNVCGAEFSWEENLQKHHRMHVVDNYKCQFCEKIFCDTISLRIHQRVHRPSTKPPTPDCKPFHCSQCGLRFQFDFSYQAHMNSHKFGGSTNTREGNTAADIAKDADSTESFNLRDENDLFQQNVNKNRIPAHKVSIHANQNDPYKLSENANVMKKDQISNINFNKIDYKNCIKAGKSHAGQKKRFYKEKETNKRSATKESQKRKSYSGIFGTLEMTDSKDFKCNICSEEFRWEISLIVHKRKHQPGYDPNQEKTQAKRKVIHRHQYYRMKEKQNDSPQKSQLVKRCAGSDDEDDDDFQTVQSEASVKPRKKCNRKTRRGLKSSAEELSLSLSSEKHSDVPSKRKTQGKFTKLKKNTKNCNNINVPESVDEAIKDSSDLVSADNTGPTIPISTNDTHSEELEISTTQSSDQKAQNHTENIGSVLSSSVKESVQNCHSSSYVNTDSTNQSDNESDTLEESQLFISVEPESESGCDEPNTKRLKPNDNSETQNIETNIAKELSNFEVNTNKEILVDSLITDLKVLESMKSDKGNIAVNRKLDSSTASDKSLSSSDFVKDIISENNIQKKSLSEDSGAQLELSGHFIKAPITEISPIPIPPSVSNYTESLSNYTGSIQNSIDVSNLSHLDIFSSSGSNAIISVTPIGKPGGSLSSADSDNKHTPAVASNNLPLELSKEQSDSLKNSIGNGVSSDLFMQNTSSTHFLDYNDDISDQFLQGISNLIQAASGEGNSNAPVEKFNASTNKLKEMLQSESLTGNPAGTSEGVVTQNIIENESAVRTGGIFTNMTTNQGLKAVQHAQVSHDLVQNINATQNMLNDVQQRKQVASEAHSQTKNVEHVQLGNILQPNSAVCGQSANSSEGSGLSSLSQIQNPVIYTDLTDGSKQNFTDITVKFPVQVTKGSSVLAPLLNVNSSKSNGNENLQAIEEVVCKIPLVPSHQISNNGPTVQQQILPGLSKPSGQTSGFNTSLPGTQTSESQGNVVHTCQPNSVVTGVYFKEYQQAPASTQLSEQRTVKGVVNDTNYSVGLQVHESQRIISASDQGATSVTMQKCSGNGVTQVVTDSLTLDSKEKHNVTNICMESQNNESKSNMLVQKNSSESLSSQSDLIIVDSNSPILDFQTSKSIEDNEQNSEGLQSNTDVQNANVSSAQIVQQNIVNVALSNVRNQQNFINNQPLILGAQNIPTTAQQNLLNAGLTNMPVIQGNVPINVVPQNTILCPSVQGNVQFVQGPISNLQSGVLPVQQNLQNSVPPLNNLGMNVQTGVSLIGGLSNLIGSVPVQTGYIPAQQINCLNEFGQLVAVTPLFQIPVNQNQIGQSSIATNILHQNANSCLLQGQQILTQPVVGENVMQTLPPVNNTGNWQVNAATANTVNVIGYQGSTNAGVNILNNNMVGQFQNAVSCSTDILDKVVSIPVTLPQMNLSNTTLQYGNATAAQAAQGILNHSNVQVSDTSSHIAQLDGCYNQECISEVYFPHFCELQNCSKTLGLPQIFSCHLNWKKILNKKRRAMFCLSCKKMYINRYFLEIHKLSHLRRAGVVKCKVCDIEFSNKLQAISHNIIHSKISCHICGKVFQTKKQLKLHLFFHQRMVPGIRCNICGLLFLDVKGLIIHSQNCSKSHSW